jgi:hypothetical protein
LVDSSNSCNFRYKQLDMNTTITLGEFLILGTTFVLGYVLVKTIVQTPKSK